MMLVVFGRHPLGLRDKLARDRENRNERLLEGHLEPASPVSVRRNELVCQLLELLMC